MTQDLFLAAMKEAMALYRDLFDAASPQIKQATADQLLTACLVWNRGLERFVNPLLAALEDERGGRDA